MSSGRFDFELVVEIATSPWLLVEHYTDLRTDNGAVLLFMGFSAVLLLLKSTLVTLLRS